MARFILDVLTHHDTTSEDIDTVFEIFNENFGGFAARLTIVDKTNETTLHEDESKNVLTPEQVEKFNADTLKLGHR